MNKDLIERIRVFNNIKYGTSDNETRIILATLKPKGTCLLYTSPSPRDGLLSRMPSSA